MLYDLYLLYVHMLGFSVCATYVSYIFITRAI